MNSACIFSDCRRWRYALTRVWEPHAARLVVIGLNPSTADETQDDPTIRRCIAFAKRWNYGGLTMLNIFAYRATDPKVMKAQDDPVGAMNDAVIESQCSDAGLILAAWGAHGSYRDRSSEVLKLLCDRDVYCLGTTSSGQPRHPLYLRADSVPTIFQPEWSR